MTIKFAQFSLVCGMTALLIACGGGGSSANTPSLSGVSAIGTAFSLASVTLKDSNGKTATTTTDDSGNFSFSDISTFTPPLMLQVTGNVAGQSYVLHSLMTNTPAKGTNTLNVTPATEAIATQTLGGDPALTFADADKIKKIDPAKLTETKSKLTAALKEALVTLNVDNMDVMSGKFEANKIGMDKLFDLVEFSADSGTGIVKLTNKNTRSAITVNADAKVSDIKTIALSKDEASLDISGINDFVKLFMQAVNKTDKNAFIQLLDKDFLNQGSNLTSVINDLSSSSTKLSGGGYAIKKCDPGTKICTGTMNLKFVEDGTTYPLYMPLKKGSDGKWRAYGDQAPFLINFYPISVRSDLIDSNSKNVISSESAVGLSIDFSGSSCQSCYDHKYLSSVFEMSIDGGNNYSTLLKLNSKNDLYMGLDDGSGNITSRKWLDGVGSYFVKYENNELIKAYNQALQAGSLKLRVKAYTQRDYAGSPVVWNAQTLSPLFEKTTNLDSIYTAQELTINEKTLGTANLTFTGKNLVDSYFLAFNAASKVGAGEYFYYEAINALLGVVTPAKLKTQCDATLKYFRAEDSDYHKSQCAILGGSNLTIDQAILISQNSQGSRIYLSKKLNY